MTEVSGFRVQDLGLKVVRLPATLHRMEKRVETDMETGMIF